MIHTCMNEMVDTNDDEYGYVQWRLLVAMNWPKLRPLYYSHTTPLNATQHVLCVMHAIHNHITLMVHICHMMVHTGWLVGALTPLVPHTGEHDRHGSDNLYIDIWIWHALMIIMIIEMHTTHKQIDSDGWLTLREVMQQMHHVPSSSSPPSRSRWSSPLW